MASFSQLFLLLIASLVLIIMAMSMESTITVFARSLPTANISSSTNLTTPTLAVRLQSNGSSECWESLIELKACTGEVILFFLNGETYLGQNCCHAIQIIQHKCWPAMLGSLGFTPEESNILRGYCEATIDDDNNIAAGSTSPPSPPSLALSVIAREDSRP